MDCNFKQISDACKSNTVYISRKVNLKKRNREYIIITIIVFFKRKMSGPSGETLCVYLCIKTIINSEKNIINVEKTTIM